MAYHDYKSITDIAQEVRENLQKEFPECTWSVTVQKYSMGRTLKVALMSAPFKVFAKDVSYNGYPVEGYAQLNRYQFNPEDWERGDQVGLNNGVYLTRKAWDMLGRAVRIANKDNWDNSDYQTDYYDVNYHFDIEVGRWNKPFEIKEKKEKKATRTVVRNRAGAGRTRVRNSNASVGRAL